MRPMSRFQGVRAARFLVVLVLAACEPFGASSPSGPQFVIPAEGTVLTEPTTLGASGEALDVVRFEVDDTVLFEDSVAPFEWTLDPADLGEGEHMLSIHADSGDDTYSISTMVTVPGPGEEPPEPPETGPPPTGDPATDIANLGAKRWYEIPNTRLDAVAPDPVPAPGHVGGVIGAWSGGAYDTKRDRLVVWGGGHGDYSGNEIYVFSMKTFQWSRITSPSSFGSDPNNTADAPRHADGRPVSRHTYDYLEYIPPPVDRFFCAGGAGLWKSGQFGDEATYYFDFDALEWETLGVCPTSNTGNTTAVGADGLVWSHGMVNNKCRLASFDPSTRAWTNHVFLGAWLSAERTAEIDPVENKYVMVGRGEVLVWDLDNPDQQHASPATTGATEAEDLGHPGFTWDPVTKEILAWQGGSTVYSYKVSTAHWTAHSTSGANTTPPSAAGTGTNGRWRYVPSLNVFVVVNRVTGNVFVYRHTSGG